MYTTTWHDVRDAIDHQHLACTKLVLDRGGTRPYHGAPCPVMMAFLTESSHIHFRKVGLRRRVDQERGRIFWVRRCFRTCGALAICPDDSFARIQLRLGEKTSHTVSHLDQQLAVHIAIVRKEEHGDFSLLLRERLDGDIIAQRLAFLGDSIKREGRIQQSVSADSFVLKVDSKVRN